MEEGRKEPEGGETEVHLPSLIAASFLNESFIIPKRFMVVLDDAGAAVTLTVLLGWMFDDSVNKIDKNGGVWVAPTDSLWQQATCLSSSALTKSLALLKSAGFVEVRSFTIESNGSSDVGVTRAPHYRLIWGKLDSILAADRQIPQSVTTPGKQRVAKREAGAPVTLEDLGHNPHPDDIERLREAIALANLLAKLVEMNGSKAPVVTKTWVDEFDKMLRLDGYTKQQIENGILWAQADDFWWKNIRSPQKLRKHFEMLREQARREPQKAKQQISKSQRVLDGSPSEVFAKSDVFNSEQTANGELSASEEENLAKSWGMVWDEGESRWVQPRPELPDFLNEDE